jgi:predicted phosphodiesterase
VTLPTGEVLYQRILEDGKTISELAVEYGRGRKVIEKAIDDYKAKRNEEDRQLFNVVHLGTPLALRGDFVVIGDIHVPTTDWDFAQLPAQVAERHLTKGNRRLIIGGDFFSQDQFSNYAAVTHCPTWREERDAGRVFLKRYLEVFDEIYIVMGNHDRRLQKWANGELEETDIFGMLIQNPKVTVSNYGWLTVETPSGPWRITHSSNYSINQLTVADQLASKFQCNVITHHEHHLAKGFDKWGRYILVNNGTLVDPKKLAYVMMDDSKMPAMINGFTLLKNGTPHLFGRAPFTDWSAWL